MAHLARVEVGVGIVCVSASCHRIILGCDVTGHDGDIRGLHLRDERAAGQRLVGRGRDVAVERHLVARQHLFLAFKCSVAGVRAIVHRNLVLVGTIVGEAERKIAVGQLCGGGHDAFHVNLAGGFHVVSGHRIGLARRKGIGIGAFAFKVFVVDAKDKEGRSRDKRDLSVLHQRFIESDNFVERGSGPLCEGGGGRTAGVHNCGGIRNISLQMRNVVTPYFELFACGPAHNVEMQILRAGGHHDPHHIISGGGPDLLCLRQDSAVCVAVCCVPVGQRIINPVFLCDTRVIVRVGRIDKGKIVGINIYLVALSPCVCCSKNAEQQRHNDGC